MSPWLIKLKLVKYNSNRELKIEIPRLKLEKPTLRQENLRLKLEIPILKLEF